MSSDFLALPLSDHPVWVGFSGGLDSTVLLHWLACSDHQRALGLWAVHINHGLHPDASRWADHCQALCDQLNIPLHTVPVEVSRQTGGGIEDAARSARRAAFAALLPAGHRLALAHHRDDQAETWLLRSLRGSGVDGLAAMRPLVAFEAGEIWRPFLATSRAQLCAYARSHGLRWIDDPSNQDTAIDRNYLRWVVLPLLEKRFPQAAQRLTRCARLCADAADLLTAEEDAALATLCPTPQTLKLLDWYAYPTARRGRLLRRWCALCHAPPLAMQGIHAIEAFMGAAPDRQACFRWQNVEIRCWKQMLYLRRCQPQWSDHPPILWDGTSPLRLPTGGSLRVETAPGSCRQGFQQPLTVRPRVGGERMRLDHRRHSHSLKHLLQQANIPPWHRQVLPLLYHGQALWAAADVIISAPLANWLAQTNQQLKWVTGDALPNSHSHQHC